MSSYPSSSYIHKENHKSDLIKFSAEVDLPYRLKKNEDNLLFYGYEFGRDLHFNLLSSIAELADKTYEEAFKHSLTTDMYKFIINESEEDLIKRTYKSLKDLTKKQIHRYIPLVENNITESNLIYFFQKERIKRKNSFLNDDLAKKILANGHLESFI